MGDPDVSGWRSTLWFIGHGVDALDTRLLTDGLIRWRLPWLAVRLPCAQRVKQESLAVPVRS